MGGNPKALVQHLAGETSLLGTTGVQPWLPGSSDIMRGSNGHGRAHHNDSISINIGLKKKSSGANTPTVSSRGRIVNRKITRQKPEDTIESCGMWRKRRTNS